MSMQAEPSLSHETVLLQSSMQQLRTPGVQTFLHLLPTALLLWFTVDVDPLSLESILATIVPTVLTGLQVGAV